MVNNVNLDWLKNCFQKRERNTLIRQFLWRWKETEILTKSRTLSRFITGYCLAPWFPVNFRWVVNKTSACWTVRYLFPNSNWQNVILYWCTFYFCKIVLMERREGTPIENARSSSEGTSKSKNRLQFCSVRLIRLWLNGNKRDQRYSFSFTALLFELSSSIKGRSIV